MDALYIHSSFVVSPLSIFIFVCPECSSLFARTVRSAINVVNWISVLVHNLTGGAEILLNWPGAKPNLGRTHT